MRGQLKKSETTKNDVDVDVFTSATKNKTRTTGLAGGSYHENADGSQIDGIRFAVKVDPSVDLTKYKEVKDTDKVDITVTNRGQTSTTTLEGKDALEKAMKAAGALKESDYTADSWKALQSALAEADTALKEKKNQDTVDKATEQLNKAISALVKKDAGQKADGTNGATGTTGSTSNTKSGKAAKTGDPSGMFAWLGLAVTSLGAGIGGFSLKRKKREDEE